MSFPRSASFRAVLLLAAAVSLSAHIGSPDIYFDGNAGPYKLFVTIRPPTAIPGVAELEVRAADGEITAMDATPMPMTGPGAKYAPRPDALHRSPQDAQFFTGSLWLMASGAWEVRIHVTGARGEATLPVPVPAVARQTKQMQLGLGLGLLGLMCFLVIGMVAIVGASVREAQLDAGLAPTDTRKTRAKIAMTIAGVLIVLVLWQGRQWWNSEASAYGQYVYKPLNMTATLETGDMLALRLSDPGWLRSRRNDDFIPDHNHLMHLYVIRQPGMDVVFHLHPVLSGPGEFQLRLPHMPGGEYRLYADVVHASGLAETAVTTISLPEVTGHTMTGDDAGGSASAITSSGAELGNEFGLPDGYRMVWVREAQPLVAKRAYSFRFRLVDGHGGAPGDMAFYMGMLGHAAFVKTDGSVFAHIHPIGTVAMASYMMAQGQTGNGNGMAMAMPGMDHPGMVHGEAVASALPNEVSFPYGFPTPGRYRIFVQMKHGDTVETGIFDTDVR